MPRKMKDEEKPSKAKGEILKENIEIFVIAESEESNQVVLSGAEDIMDVGALMVGNEDNEEGNNIEPENQLVPSNQADEIEYNEDNPVTGFLSNIHKAIEQSAFIGKIAKLLKNKQTKRLKKCKSTDKCENEKATEPSSFKVRQPSHIAGERKSVQEKNLHTTQSEYESQRLLFKRCDQKSPLPFEEVCNPKKTEFRKLSEGSFGEVFVCTYNNNKDRSVIKIIPFEGDTTYNSDGQKTYKEILPEILISQELSELRKFEEHANATSTFVEVKSVKCVQGRYPKPLLDNWISFRCQNGTTNDNPSFYANDQHFIVLELGHGGLTIDNFMFTNAEQSYAALKQVTYALAVAERELCFEHRDLHIGNVLVDCTNKKTIDYKLDDNIVKVASKGVQVSIIDYTFSRIKYNGTIYFNDLTKVSRIFDGTSVDYQFEIYRLMREEVNNCWRQFKPKTNVLWVHYFTNALLEECHYRHGFGKQHSDYIRELNRVLDSALNYKSCVELVSLFRED